MLAAGEFNCTVLNASYGANSKGVREVTVTARITSGPDEGMMATYASVVDNKQAPFIANVCKAVGWSGTTLLTLSADVDAWIKATGGKSTLEIRHIEFTDKKTGAPRIWDKVQRIGAGRTLTQPRAADVLEDDSLFKGLSDEGAPF